MRITVKKHAVSKDLKNTVKGREKKIKLLYTGDVQQDDLLIGSHGHTDIKIDGNFDISGIVYCPKYTVTMNIKGHGRLSLRGKCDRIIIKKMQGNCTLDLTEVTYKNYIANRCQADRW
jgi:hypothetical protein